MKNKFKKTSLQKSHLLRTCSVYLLFLFHFLKKLKEAALDLREESTVSEPQSLF